MGPAERPLSGQEQPLRTQLSLRPLVATAASLSRAPPPPPPLSFVRLHPRLPLRLPPLPLAISCHLHRHTGSRGNEAARSHSLPASARCIYMRPHSLRTHRTAQQQILPIHHPLLMLHQFLAHRSPTLHRRPCRLPALLLMPRPLRRRASPPALSIFVVSCCPWSPPG